MSYITIFERHGLSTANSKRVNPKHVGDANIVLEPEGEKEALDLCFRIGHAILTQTSIYGSKFLPAKRKHRRQLKCLDVANIDPQFAWEVGRRYLKSAGILCSTYVRTIQTRDKMLEGAKIDPHKIAENMRNDDRLREIDLGDDDYEEQQDNRKKKGWYWFRYHNGESPAAVADRLHTWLPDALYFRRQRKLKCLSVTSHGMTIRVAIKLFFHLSVADFCRMRNPNNCDVIIVAPKKLLKDPQFTYKKWGVVGLKLRAPKI
jgi:broad specificity phosphatase PhoE